VTDYLRIAWNAEQSTSSRWAEEEKAKEKALLLLHSGVNPSLGHTSAVRAEMEIPKEQMEQRLNFNGDPSNPHSHDNGNGFNHFQPLDSGYALNHSVPRPPRKRPWHHSNQGTSPGTTIFLTTPLFARAIAFPCCFITL